MLGICQKRIGKAKRIQQKINWSDLAGPSNSWKCSKIAHFAQNAQFWNSFMNRSARLSQINLIFAGFCSPCRYASDKYHKWDILLKKYFDSKGEMCPSRTIWTANPEPKTQFLAVLKHCSLIIFVRYIKKIARHIIILNFPQNDPFGVLFTFQFTKYRWFPLPYW